MFFLIRKILFLLLLFILQFELLASSDIDSLKHELDNAEGKDKIEIFIKLSQEFERSIPEEANKFADEALKLLNEFPDKEQEAEIYYRKGWIFYYKNDYDSVKYFVNKIKNISDDENYARGFVISSFLLARVHRDEGDYQEALKILDEAKTSNDEAKDKQLEIKILNEYGSVYRRLSRYDESLEHHLQALELFKEYEDKEELISTYTLLGIINDLKSNYDEALGYYHKALTLNKAGNNIRGIAGSIHNIGILYHKTGRYQESLEYYYQALNYWKELGSREGLASTLNSLGAVNELLGKHKDALGYYQQALEIWVESGNENSISIALNNIGSIQEYLGNYNEAALNLQKAIAVREKSGDRYGLSGSMIILASVYNKLGKKDSAINLAKRSLEIAKEIKNPVSVREAHLNLSDIYEKNGLFKNALIEYKNYKAVNDSILNSETQQAISEVQEKYKSEEQKQQIQILTKESEIESLYRTILIALLILITLILILIYNRYRLKKTAHEALQKLHQNEIENARLKMEAVESKAAILQVEYEQKKKELDTARDLQLSMLPAKIPEHRSVSISALMLTATEVGGDYYDFYSSQDGALTIAIGDATGHGAQAGLMVTAVKSLFNLLADSADITKILMSSTKAIKKLHLPNSFMAFGILRLTDHELQLSGAGMPPAYIYRADSETIETVSLKGLPLGTVYDHQYQKKCVKLKKDDVVLLMSDGFPELFNEELETIGFDIIPELLMKSGKKFPDEIIKDFTQTADNWLNGNKQQDDMTFLVLKVKE